MTDEDAKKIARHMIASEGTAEAWGTEYLGGGVGHARVSFKIKPNMLNGLKTAHGGIIFSLADSAFAYACNSRNQIAVAQQCSISFIGPAYEGDILIAEATEQSIAGRSGVYNVSVKTSDGRPIAEFQGLSRQVKGLHFQEE